MRILLVLLCYCVCGQLAQAQSVSPVILTIDHLPTKLGVGESYSFYINAKNISVKPFEIAIEYKVRDNSIRFNHVRIAKEKGARISREPIIPRTRTDFNSTSTAICEWGVLNPQEHAKCAFDISALGSTIDPIPFVITVRDLINHKLLAGHVLKLYNSSRYIYYELS